MAWWDGWSEEDLVKFELTPTSHLVIDGKEIQVHRCETCGVIVTDKPEHLPKHGGHKVRQPVCIKRDEVELIIKGAL